MKISFDLIKTMDISIRKNFTANLALLVAISEYLQAVSGDGQELGGIVPEEENHLLQTTCRVHCQLGALLMKQQVVEGCDGIK